MVAGMSLTALGCWYVPTPVAWDCDPGLQGRLLLRRTGRGSPILRGRTGLQGKLLLRRTGRGSSSYGEEPGYRGSCCYVGRGEGAPSYGEEPRAWLLLRGRGEGAHPTEKNRVVLACAVMQCSAVERCVFPSDSN